MTAWERIKERYRGEYERNPVLTLLLTILIVFFLVFVIAAVITGGDSVLGIFFYDRKDTFMDFFNSVMHAQEGPYDNWHVIYPPLIVVFYSIVGRFMIPYVETKPGELLSFALRNTQMGLLTYVFITLMTVFVLYLVVSRLMEERGIRKELVFAFLVFLSFPLVYAFERGNSIILALVFCFAFLLGYRSENKYVRYASYIALGIAAGIKLYPAILWLLILRDRNYKESAICFAIVSAVLLLPFIFTDGTPLTLVHNVFTYTGSPDTYGFANLNQLIFGVFRDLIGVAVGTVQIISYAVIGIFTLLSFIVILFDKEMKFWKVVTLLGCNLVLGLGVGGIYQMLYMLPAVLLFLNAERTLSRENLFYLVSFALVFALVPGIMPFDILPSPIIGSFKAAILILISAALLREGLGRLWRKRAATPADACCDK